MDTTTWLLLGGLALIAAIAALVALKRSWGNFPDRAGTLPPAGSSAPGMSSAPSTEWEEPGQFGAPAQPTASAPMNQDGGLVPIEHPLVRRSAEQALARGGAVTRYITRQGDQLYFDFSPIADPEQRRQAYDLMRRFNAGQDVDLPAMMRMVNQLFKQ
jgi:hypothetical protein